MPKVRDYEIEEYELDDEEIPEESTQEDIDSLDPYELELMTRMLVEAGDDEDLIEFVRKNIHYLKEICCIAYENLMDIKVVEPKYNDYYSFTDSLQIAREFIGFISPKYLEKFDKLFAEGNMDVVAEPEQEDEDGYVNHDEVDGKIRSDVHIPLKHNLDDVYAYVHEFFHTTNLGNLKSFDRTMFTEVVSIFFELVLHDYLRTKDVNQDDNNASIYWRLNSFADNLYDCNDVLEYVYAALNDMNLDYEEKSDDEELSEDVEDVYYRIKDNVIYLISTLIAFIKFHEYKQGYIGLQNMIEFNERLEHEEGLNSLNYINANAENITEEEISSAIRFINQVLIENKNMKR